MTDEERKELPPPPKPEKPQVSRRIRPGKRSRKKPVLATRKDADTGKKGRLVNQNPTRAVALERSAFVALERARGVTLKKVSEELGISITAAHQAEKRYYETMAVIRDLDQDRYRILTYQGRLYELAMNNHLQAVNIAMRADAPDAAHRRALEWWDRMEALLVRMARIAGISLAPDVVNVGTNAGANIGTMDARSLSIIQGAGSPAGAAGGNILDPEAREALARHVADARRILTAAGEEQRSVSRGLPAEVETDEVSG